MLLFFFKLGDILGTNPGIHNHSHACELQVASAIWIQETGKGRKETLKDLCFAAVLWTLNWKTRILKSQISLFLLKKKKVEDLAFYLTFFKKEYVTTSQNSFLAFALQVVSWRSGFMSFSEVTHKHILFYPVFWNVSMRVHCSNLFPEMQQHHDWFFFLLILVFFFCFNCRRKNQHALLMEHWI